MQTDLFTVQKDDIVELVAELMDWNQVRYTPVENTKGDLVGLVSVGNMLKHYVKNNRSKKTVTVEEVMVKDVISIDQDSNILDAIKIMQDHKIGCLPVVDHNELVGLVTESELLKISSRVLHRISKKQ